MTGPDVGTTSDPMDDSALSATFLPPAADMNDANSDAPCTADEPGCCALEATLLLLISLTSFSKLTM